ncbi:MAG: MBL fold metallo-hydrolase [Oscillospiraceae bacterium]|nr:MBL fold metallo-hydrolase [Oscillospiraceae bacterium]MCL2279400.1 MBL fold metallo-hydrolase [Oscillospiraceae bacterium]
MITKKKVSIILLAAAVLVAGTLLTVYLLRTAQTNSAMNLTAEPMGACCHTADINRAVLDLLDFSDEQEFEFARRGLIAIPDFREILDDDGNVVWSFAAFDFVVDTLAPDTANPSLWRHTQLNQIHGLFEVTEGIYQVRGFCCANLTLIAGENGWIIFDPLKSIETARTALAFANEHLGERSVSAVVISHTHVDHFGGIRGVISEENIETTPIIVPEHFERYAVSENVYAGVAMGRRAFYMYGMGIVPGPMGRLAIGIGLGVPHGTISYLPPNDWITYTGEVRVVDGIEMVFQMTPGTEAPAAMNTWFPAKNALWMAENCSGTMHNLYTLRGAQVRDGNAWAYHLMESVTLFAADADVLFAAHNWPRWGNGHISEYLINTAAIYKFINDQTLLYINQGFTSGEIAHMIRLPESLEQLWYTRPYYGTLQHNSRAVYQRFMGWYDGNPVNLHPLPPSEFAERMVEYLGCVDRVMELAWRDFERGYFQWVAQITNILVFADPTNMEARLLCAAALEQLGYQAESGIWRAAYLTGAMELRYGVYPTDNNASGDLVRAMQPTMVFDYLGIRINSVAAGDLNFRANVNLIGGGEYLLTMRAGVLLYQRNTQAVDADVTLTLPVQLVWTLLAPEGLGSDHIEIEGNKELFASMYQFMGEFDSWFNIIEP